MVDSHTSPLVYVMDPVLVLLHYSRLHREQNLAQLDSRATEDLQCCAFWPYIALR